MTEISIPFRNEDDLTIDVAAAANQVLEGEELRVVEQVAYDAMVRGKTTVGDLLGELEAAGPEGRRRIVDQARVACGLDTLEDAAAHQRFLQANAALRGMGRDAEGKSIQRCHAPDCHVMPQDEQGCMIPVAEKRWFCGQHRHLAEPGDLEPPDDLRPRFDPMTMRLLPSRAEEERLRRQEEQRQEEKRKRLQLRREEAERMRALEEARFAQMVKELPPGLGG